MGGFSWLLTEVGSSALVLKDEEVSLTNPGEEPAEVIVSAGPADFVVGIRQWSAPRNLIHRGNITTAGQVRRVPLGALPLPGMKDREDVHKKFVPAKPATVRPPMWSRR
ncbi:hypothetical protein B0G38_002377 [Arthrobacter sp. VKM Ac-2550]|nr:hypothetical protein [Arthrobacter sp. VKM Ac-2550]